MNAPAEFIRALPLAQLAPSPFNPRRAVDQELLAELAASIRTDGVLQPIVVRPITKDSTQRLADLDNGARWQIIAGHRRVAAAELAGLAEVPAVVRAMTDADVKAAHLIENLQRENLQALEEAEGYARLRDEEGLATAEAIAARVGRKKGVVYNRLKLLELCDEARTALAAGLIGAEVGVLIARIPVPKLQVKALAIATERKYRDEPKSYREIRDALVEQFTLKLREAIFDRTDGALVPSAGACTGCVKRSGGDPHLFSDILQKDDRYGSKHGGEICTDPDCFAAKKAAHLKQQADRLAERGREVITGAAAKKALAVGYDYGSGRDKVTVKGTEFVPLDHVKSKLKLAKAEGAAAPQPVILQDPRTGKTVQAVRRADLEAAGVKIAPPPKKEESWQQAQLKEAEARKEREAAAAAENLRRAQILQAVREKIRATPRSAFDLALVARVAYAGVDYDDVALLAELWGEPDRAAMDKRLGQLGLQDLTLFVIDCALVRNAYVAVYDLHRRGQQPEPPLLAAAKHYGVDVAQFTVKPAEAKVAGKARAKKAAKKARA